jgi:SAM-dependent methyltransferase
MNSFDHVAGRYDEWYQTPLGQTADRLEKKAIFALATAEPGTACLDVGCGAGNYALDLAAKGLRAVGVDPSREMLRAASSKARRAGLHIQLVEARAERLPFSTGVFDLVIAVTTLEFAEDQATAAREMLRVLKPGGQVVVGVLMRWSVWALLRRLKGALTSTIYRSARFLAAREVRALLRSAGCESVRTWAAVFVPPVRWRTFVLGATAADDAGRRMHLPGAAFLAAAGRKAARL